MMPDPIAQIRILCAYILSDVIPPVLLLFDIPYPAMYIYKADIIIFVGTDETN